MHELDIVDISDCLQIKLSFVLYPELFISYSYFHDIFAGFCEDYHTTSLSIFKGCVALRACVIPYSTPFCIFAPFK